MNKNAFTPLEISRRDTSFLTGFTLTEILIVVVIIGLLATLALPTFVKTIEKAKVGEAMTNLNLIRTGEKIYFLEDGYFSGKITNDTEGIAALKIENPNTTNAYFDYTIPTSAGGTIDFEAWATRKADAPPPFAGNVYKIKKAGTIEGPLVP